MKIYISADIEGATGVTGWKDVATGTSSHKRFRKLLTRDVNAAITGALKACATEIIVNETHATKNKILLEELHHKAKLITGPTRFLGMMEGIDETFDAAFFIGYHTKAGMQGDNFESYTVWEARIRY